jgi:hypothetical protein
VASAGHQKDFAGNAFAGTLQGDLGLQVDGIACYCRGTLIETKNGPQNVETLEIGDEVVTASGVARPIKWIGRRSYLGRFVMGRKDILPICIKAGALADNLPSRDLWISPHHAMYFEDEGGVLIEAKELVNGISIVQAGRVDKVEYFHIELESHDVIIAEGALSETFLDDDSRGMFHNAHEYYMLHSEQRAESAHYRSPRREDGYEVEAIRRRIAGRAGLDLGGESVGELRGHIDLISADCIAGWAQNMDHPEAPVCLDIYVDGRLVGQVLANRYREDLKRAGIGSGRHGFNFPRAAGPASACGTAEVRRSFDSASLPFSVDARKFSTSDDSSTWSTALGAR